MIEDRIQVSKHFFLDEFVDPFTYFNEDDKGLSKIDERLFKIADTLREKLAKPLRINNWWQFYLRNEKKGIDWVIKNIEISDLSKWSGYRSSRCKIGAKFSAHRLGIAIDPKGDEKEMYNIMKFKSKMFYELGVRRVEDISITKGWLHVDLKPHDERCIKVVDLQKVTNRIALI